MRWITIVLGLVVVAITTAAFWPRPAALFSETVPTPPPPSLDHASALVEAATLSALGCLPPALADPQTPEDEARRSRFIKSWERLHNYASLLSSQPDTQVPMPVKGIGVRQIADTWGAPRSGGRRHEGQDIFASRGTPIYSATEGYVWRMGQGQIAGLYLYVVGPGGRRYYYAHLDRFAPGLTEGQKVTPQTLLGTVGNTGNARTTPPHLHFGIYEKGCGYRAIDPLPLLVNRNWKQLGN
jgi:murein DD-endopeptidase MepM/ murein hydrolase activator NlpD